MYECDGANYYCDGIENIAIPRYVDGNFVFSNRKLKGSVFAQNSRVAHSIYGENSEAKSLEWGRLYVGANVWLNNSKFKDVDIGGMMVGQESGGTLYLTNCKIGKLRVNDWTMISHLNLAGTDILDMDGVRIAVGSYEVDSKLKIPSYLINALNGSGKRYEKMVEARGITGTV